jgi:Na+/H+ antiporter NhaC
MRDGGGTRGRSPGREKTEVRQTDRAVKRKSSLLVQWFDVVFIMALCFVTLLATMLVRGKVLVGSGTSNGLDYSFSLITFAVVVAIFVAYIWYLLSHSDRELKEMVKHVYDEHEGDEESGDETAQTKSKESER